DEHRRALGRAGHQPAGSGGAHRLLRAHGRARGAAPHLRPAPVPRRAGDDRPARDRRRCRVWRPRRAPVRHHAARADQARAGLARPRGADHQIGRVRGERPRLHRPAARRQRRVRADGGSVRRGRPPRAERGGRVRAPARRRGRGRCDRRRPRL
ncbi:MAG: RidA/YER057c/UK114 superfamily, group 1, partial [uncultured Sphingomonadaceae bacterium]